MLPQSRKSVCLVFVQRGSLDFKLVCFKIQFMGQEICFSLENKDGNLEIKC
jgi:hypothetical protein